jgi:splicing factor 3A subunit 1
VARNGVEFENRIRQNELGNDKFKFLNPDNPYHAYYQSKVKEIRDGVAIESSIARPVITSRLNDTTKRIEFIPKEPPADFEFLAEPATINAYELDLIKMTALFCARNGRHFMTQLMNREARNYQFDFLKPQHSNFPYFTKLVEQFTKVLIPAKTMMSKAESELKEPSKVVDDVKYRVAWERHQRRLREREQAELERERQAYASIDWHDFVVVQTVDFPPNETSMFDPVFFV